MKVHLVDGTYELFRAYFGSPGATDPTGREVGAVRGLLRSVAALLAEPGVTHVGVAFDHVIESFRNDLFAGYKTSAGVPQDLLDQFWPAEEACAALGVVVWPMVRWEADDALATAAARFADQVDQVVICTPDKDMAQCVRADRVVCVDRMRQKTYDEAGVVEKFGVLPASIPDWLALVGDSADGIPGIPRWGAKSAAEVLARYGHVEAIPDQERDWDVKVRGAAALAENLRARRADALLYRVLATLATDADVPQDLDALRWQGPTSDLEDVAARLGDTGIARRLPTPR